MRKILVFVPGYLPGFKNGGPIRTVANMVNALGDEISFSVVCLDRDLGENQPYATITGNEWNQQGKAKVYYVKPGLIGALKILIIIRNNHFDIVHVNSFFSFQFSIIPIILFKVLKIDTPLIVGPRGEFSMGALAIKAKKKLAFIYLSKISNLYKNIIWHASSAHEAEDIRTVLGHNVSIRIATDIAASTPGLSIQKRDVACPLKIVFISRISPMKNLDYALEILSNIQESVIFDVYGPLEDSSYWIKCKQFINNLPKNVEFNYLGSVKPDDVISTLENYDLFFLPTRGENFGHAIAEALFAGLPVLVSDQSPWRNLLGKRLGWDFPLSEKGSFACAIKQCTEYSSDYYQDWRNHIKEWARNNIGNKEAIDATRQLFEIK